LLYEEGPFSADDVFSPPEHLSDNTENNISIAERCLPGVYRRLFAEISALWFGIKKYFVPLRLE